VTLEPLLEVEGLGLAIGIFMNVKILRGGRRRGRERQVEHETFRSLPSLIVSVADFARATSARFLTRITSLAFLQKKTAKGVI